MARAPGGGAATDAGGSGDFIGPPQDALAAIDEAARDAGEAGTARYGASTAGPVRTYRGMPAPGPATGT